MSNQFIRFPNPAAAYPAALPQEKSCDTCQKSDMYGCPDSDKCQDCEHNFKHVDHWEEKEK